MSNSQIICSHFINGTCRYSNDECHYLHLECEPRELLNFCNSKTSFCRSILNGCSCKFGDNCNYAHSNEELNTRMVCAHGLNCRNRFSRCKLEHLEQNELTCYFISQCEKMKNIK